MSKTPLPSLESLMPITGPVVRSILALFTRGITVAVGFSAGKDSECVMVLTIQAALQALAQGLTPRVLVLTANTGIENPEIEAHARREHLQLQQFASQRGIHLTIHEAKPLLTESWQLNVLSGRSLPSFAGMPAQCSVSLKINPMNRMKRAVMHESSRDGVVTLTGSRLGESAYRALKMRARGDLATQPTRNKDGDLVMAPIAAWELDDVWELLGYCRSGLVDTFSDQADTIRIYAASGGTSCPVVADMVSDERRQAGGCGSRHGCSLCLQVTSDRSMEEMIRTPEYAHMEPLNRLRNYLAAGQYYLDKRNWIGRDIVDGRIQIGPSQYAPAELLALARYCMTIDAIEAEAARELDIEPRFELLPLDKMVALDAMWSLNAVLPAHQAVKEWREIRWGSARYEIPDIVASPRRAMPKTRFLQVNPDWETLPELKYAGLVEPLADMVSEWDHCMRHVATGSGEVVLDVNTAPEMVVHEEGAWFSVSEDGAWLDKQNESCRHARLTWTAGYRRWMQLGVISINPAMLAQHSHMLRRAVYKEHLGLVGEKLDLQAILRRTVSNEPAQEEMDLFA